MDRDSIRDLAGLRAEVKARGWDVKPTGRILVQLAFHVGVTLAGLAMLLLTEDLRLSRLGPPVERRSRRRAARRSAMPARATRTRG